MPSMLSSSAAASAFPASTAEALPAQPAAAKKPAKRHSAGLFIDLCEDFRTARIELEEEVFSGFKMIVLLLDEIEHFLHGRSGSMKAVLKLLARRGLVLTERTLKDYLARARKIRSSDQGAAIAQLRESIFEEARRRGRLPSAAVPVSSGTPAASCKPAPSIQASAQPASSASAAASLPSLAAGDFGTPDAGWLDEAVLEAMEQPEPESRPGKASAAKKDKQAKRRAKRRARRAH